MNNAEAVSFEVMFNLLNPLGCNKNRACYLVKAVNRFMGVIQLNEIYNNAVRDVGMYVNPTLLNRGIGIRLRFCRA